MEKRWWATFALAGGIFAFIVIIFLWSEGYFSSNFMQRIGVPPILSFSHTNETPAFSETPATDAIPLATNSPVTITTTNTPLNSSEYDMIRRIQTEIELKQYDTALQKAAEYLASFTNGSYLSVAMYLVGFISYQKKDYETALSWCRKSIAQGIPFSYEVALASLVGFILKDSETVDPALLNWMEQIRLHHPDEDLSACALGIAYQYIYRNEAKTALLYLQEAKGELALIGRARAYILQQNYPAAIQEYENFFSLYPQSTRKNMVMNAFLKQTLGYSQWLSKSNPRLALSFYEKLLRFPNSDEAEQGIVEMVKLLREMKAYSPALNYVEKGLSNQNTKQNAVLLFEKAGILYEMGDKERSLQTYEEFLTTYPSHPLASQALQWKELLTKELTLP